MTSRFFVKYLVSTEALITNTIIQNRLSAPKKIRRFQSLFFRFMLIIISALAHIRLPMFFSVIMALTSVSDECTDWWEHFSYHVCPQISHFKITSIATMANALITCIRNSIKKLLIWYGPVTSHISRLPANGTISASLWICSLEKLSPGTSPQNRMLTS